MTLFVFRFCFGRGWKTWALLTHLLFNAAMPRIEVLNKSTWEIRLSLVISSLLQSFFVRFLGLSLCSFGCEEASLDDGKEGLVYAGRVNPENMLFLRVGCFGCLTYQESRSTRLETRTKEPNPCASGMVIGKP